MKSSMNAGSRYTSEKSLIIDVEVSRISSTFVLSPEFACSSCRSSGRAGDASRNSNRNAVAARCRATKPTSPRELRWWFMVFSSSGKTGRGTEFAVADDGLRVVQEGVVLRARGAQLDRPHVHRAVAALVALKTDGAAP